MSQDEDQTPKNRFLSDENYWIKDHLDNVMTWICGDTMDENGYIVPKLGVYSLLAQGSNAFVYDNPEFTARIGCNTAFTDGVYTYYHAPFLAELIERDSKEKTDNVLFLMLHEHSHMLLRHEFRAVEYDNDERNIGFDLFINSMQQIAFPNLKVSKDLWQKFYGFKKGDERYAKMAEEDIIREIHEERKKQPQQPPPQGGMGGAGQGSGQPGQKPDQGQQGQQGGQPPQDQGGAQNGHGQPSQSGQPGKPGVGAPGKGKPGQNGTGAYDPSLEHDNHVATVQDVVDALNESGLGHVVDIFDIPKDEAGQKEMYGAAEGRIVDAAGRINDMIKRGAKVPGAHVMDCVGQLIANLSKPKVTWKLPFRQMVLGSGMRTQRAPEISHRVTTALNQQGQRTFIAANVPAKSNSKVVVIMDTSGSMGESDLREPIEEGLGMIKQGGARAAEVAFFFTDTTLRGEPYILTNRNKEELVRKGMKVLGRGGTKLINNLNEVMSSKYVQEAVRKRQLAGVIMFSDLGDAPLLREHVHKDTPKNFTMVATSKNFSATWAANSTACRTFPIETRPTIDLTKAKP